MRDINKSDNRIFRPIAGIVGPNQSIASNLVCCKLIRNRQDKNAGVLSQCLLTPVSGCPVTKINDLGIPMIKYFTLLTIAQSDNTHCFNCNFFTLFP
ncbi:TPA: hypothetical protein ACKP1B_001296 [Serratia fonticola]